MNSIINQFKALRQFFLIALLVFLSAGYLMAQHDDHSQHNGNEDWQEEVLEEDFQAGEMIIHHITDAYE